MDEIESRHKKELKALESEKRQALKKIKGTAGKSQKARDLLAAVEEEWTRKENDMIHRHGQEISSLKELLQDRNSSSLTESNSQSMTLDDEDKVSSLSVVPNNHVEDHQQPTSSAATSKKIQKRMKQRQQQLDKEAEIANNIANAGPTARELENNRLQELYLSPIQHTIHEIKADGNCLYRAIAHQVEYITKDPITYVQIRDICANTLQNHKLDYGPFLELSDGENGVNDFDTYVENVRNSNEWGGHIELRVLAKALKRVIVVYSADSTPLYIDPEDNAVAHDAVDDECLRLSFHKFFYALGEHYNSVVRL